MAPEPTRVDTGTSSHVTVDDPAVLRLIVDSGVNLCLWQRPVCPTVASEVSLLHASSLPDVRCWTSSASFDDDVSDLLTQQGLDVSAFDNWRADMARLAELFFAICDGREVALRLETTDGDGCPRFHVDHTHLRLLCTFRGPGTEWLSDAQVNHVAQRSGAPNEDILQSGTPAHFATFWVGVMKGDAYPGNAGRGLVHRSPPIAGTGHTRVLFCLDC